MLKRLISIFPAVLFAWFSADFAARGQEDGGKQLTERALVADTVAVEAGKPFYLGFHFKIAEGWHSYWRYPGSSGSPVIVKKWTLPAGWKADAPEFPLPEEVVDKSNSVLYSYEHEAFFPVK